MGRFIWEGKNNGKETARNVLQSIASVPPPIAPANKLSPMLAIDFETDIRNLEPPNPHRRSRFLTSFDDLFKPDLPSSSPYPFQDNDDCSLRDKIRHGMEDSIIPSVNVTPVKSLKERVPLKERIKTMLNTERPRRRRRGWIEKIVGKKQGQKQGQKI